jgi:hypothetical protein
MPCPPGDVDHLPQVKCCGLSAPALQFRAGAVPRVIPRIAMQSWRGQSGPHAGHDPAIMTDGVAQVERRIGSWL